MQKDNKLNLFTKKNKTKKKGPEVLTYKGLLDKMGSSSKGKYTNPNRVLSSASCLISIEGNTHE